jgi:hypothetical protein
MFGNLKQRQESSVAESCSISLYVGTELVHTQPTLLSSITIMGFSPGPSNQV